MDIDIIVPVYHRPQNARPFMESLRDTDNGQSWVFPIVDETDIATADAWWEVRDVRVCPIVARRGPRFAQKAQQGYLTTGAEWILVVGDDVHYTADWAWQWTWYVTAEIGLIATNDGHNPYVLGGTHATHPIMRRDWVDQFGASWDGPGHIAHEGYHHAYVDAEWSARAIQDGAFAFAETCLIEHLHPTWGKAPTDDTYREGMRHYDRDRRLFERRQAQYGEAQI